MNAFWQRIFLTVGILIAVFGMRLVFPVVIVAITAKLGPDRGRQARDQRQGPLRGLVTDAHPAIAAFGGMFLLMIFLDFIFEDRDIKWLALDGAAAGQARQARHALGRASRWSSCWSPR